MKRYWDEHELAEHWSLNADERELLANRTDRSRLGLAVLLKFFQGVRPVNRVCAPSGPKPMMGRQRISAEG